VGPLEGGCPFYQGKLSQNFSRSNFPMAPGAKSPFKGGGLPVCLLIVNDPGCLIKIIQNKYHIPPGNSPSSGKHGKYVQPFCVKYASFKTTDDFASSLRVKRIQTIPLPPYMPHPPHVAPWSKGRRIFFLAPLYFVGHTICPPHIWPPWGSGGPKMGAYEGGVVLSILVCEINIVSAHSVTASHIFFRRNSQHIETCKYQ